MLTRPCFLSPGFPALPPEALFLQAGRELASGLEGDRPPLMMSIHRHREYSLSFTAVATGSCPGVKTGGKGFTFSKRENSLSTNELLRL